MRQEHATSLFEELAELEASRPPGRRRWALLLLLIPLGTIVYPPLYNHRSPQLAGVPFFVWYQIAAVIAGGAVTGVVYLLRGTERSLDT